MASAKLTDDCLFCKILRGEIPSYKVAETELSYAFLDINPVAKGHTQIIPKYHAVKLDELPDEYLADLLPLARRVALSTGVVDYNILQNNGTKAFQHVPHVHVHVVPKPSESEGMIFKLSPDMWPIRKATVDELKATAEEMQTRM